MTLRRATAAGSIGVLLMVVFAPTSFGDTSRFRAVGCTEDPHWEPTKRAITKGDRIVWKNPTSCNHTVTAYSGRWSKNTTLRPGDSTRKRFRRTGLYKFRCMTVGHSAVEDGVCNGMCGRVRVRS
jgi:plastocyanin